MLRSKRPRGSGSFSRNVVPVGIITAERFVTRWCSTPEIGVLNVKSQRLAIAGCHWRIAVGAAVARFATKLRAPH